MADHVTLSLQFICAHLRNLRPNR